VCTTASGTRLWAATVPVPGEELPEVGAGGAFGIHEGRTRMRRRGLDDLPREGGGELGVVVVDTSTTYLLSRTLLLLFLL
jgi:hypothetical protein